MKQLLTVFIACLWGMVFIAIPGWAAKQLYVHFAFSSRVLPLSLEDGVLGFLLRFALPALFFQVTGMTAGFCVGVFIVSRIMGKQRMMRWLLESQNIPFFSRLAVRIANTA